MLSTNTTRASLKRAPSHSAFAIKPDQNPLCKFLGVSLSFDPAHNAAPTCMLVKLSSHKLVSRRPAVEYSLDFPFTGL